MTKTKEWMLGMVLPLLAMAVCPLAQAQVAWCSNLILKGHFAVIISGQTGVPTSPVPSSGVSMTQFDGLGGVTDVDHIVGNGTQPPVEWRSGAGTYTVNPDCTGKFEVNFPGAPTLVVYFVVGKLAKAFRGVGEAPGANVIAERSAGRTSSAKAKCAPRSSRC